jgi:hypothetical protein
MFPLQKESHIKLKIHHICKTLTWDLFVSTTCYFSAGGVPILVLIKGKTTGNPSHQQQQQLKVTCSAANKWPGSGLLTPNHAFLSSFPASTVSTCCASLLSLRHASEPWI